MSRGNSTRWPLDRPYEYDSLALQPPGNLENSAEAWPSSSRQRCSAAASNAASFSIPYTAGRAFGAGVCSARRICMGAFGDNFSLGSSRGPKRCARVVERLERPNDDAEPRRAWRPPSAGPTCYGLKLGLAFVSCGGIGAQNLLPNEGSVVLGT